MPLTSSILIQTTKTSPKYSTSTARFNQTTTSKSTTTKKTTTTRSTTTKKTSTTSKILHTTTSKPTTKPTTKKTSTKHNIFHTTTTTTRSTTTTKKTSTTKHLTTGKILHATMRTTPTANTSTIASATRKSTTSAATTVVSSTTAFELSATSSSSSPSTAPLAEPINAWHFDASYLDSVTSLSLTNPVNVSFTLDRRGRAQSALALNSGYIQLPNATYFTGDFAVSLWVYSAHLTGNWQALLEFKDTDSNWTTNRFNIYVWNGTVWGAELVSSTGLVYNNFASAPISVGVWTHLAATLLNTTYTFYVNAVTQDTQTVAEPPFDGQNTRQQVWCYLGAPEWPFYGYVDDLLLWNVGLTQDQIVTAMNQLY